MNYRHFYIAGLQVAYQHREQFAWSYPVDTHITTTAHVVARLKASGHSWKEIAEVVDRNVRTVKLIHRNYLEQGLQGHEPDTPGWHYQHERFGEYPPKGAHRTLRHPPR